MLGPSVHFRGIDCKEKFVDDQSKKVRFDVLFLAGALQFEKRVSVTKELSKHRAVKLAITPASHHLIKIIDSLALR